jgi:hypothetical protein
MIFVNPSDGISFNVSSPSGFTINDSGIQLMVNDVDVSGSLAISGSSNKAWPLRTPVQPHLRRPSP